MGINSLRQKEASIRAEIKGAQGRLDRVLQQIEEIEFEQNSPNFDNIEWLINNPEAAGQYNALKAWLTNRFGDDCSGISNFGYYPDTNQQCFSLHLGWEGDGYEDRALYRSNIKAFMGEALGYFKPRDGLVSFTFASGQHSGMRELAYVVDNDVWQTQQVTYGRTHSVVRHESLDAALMAATQIKDEVDD